jgi:hypothetical protein
MRKFLRFWSATEHTREIYLADNARRIIQDAGAGMERKTSRMWLRRKFALAATMGLTLVSATALRSPDVQAAPTPTYSIDFYVISNGGGSLKNSCFRLSGTIGQPAPGYSSGAIFSLIAGYWQPAVAITSDEIFYNGFEGCSI